MKQFKVKSKTNWKYILPVLVAFGIGSTLGPSSEELTAANEEVEIVQNKLENEVEKNNTLIAEKIALQTKVDEAETWLNMTDEQRELAKVTVQKAEEQAKAEAEEKARKEAEEQAKKEAEEKAKAEEQAKKEAEEAAKKAEEAEKEKIITESKLKTIVEDYALTEGDSLVSASIINNEIKASIELASNGIFPIEDIAVVTYSQLSDELLNFEGWDRLTVKFPNVGTISMHRNEKETNEYGSYFPTVKIEQRLNY